jgi:F0F1-type ATP synthase assembly protein I
MKKNSILPIIPKKDKNVLKYITLMGQIGAVMVSSILIFFLIFYFLGKKFHFEALAIPLGVLLGLFGGFYSVYKLLKNFFEKNNDDDNN